MPLRRWRRRLLLIAGLLLVAALVEFAIVCRSQAHTLVTNPAATRHVPSKTPADFNMPYEDVSVMTGDGLKLVGWWIPPAHQRVIMIVPGYKAHRGQALAVASLLKRHGYGVLMLSLRAHDRSDGELITFGARELGDLEAWHRSMRARADGGRLQVGLLGISLGGSLGIRLAAERPDIAAVVADCAFSSVEDTIATSVRHFTGLPPFPFAPAILFFVERETGFRPPMLDTRTYVQQISPRPILLLQGGADVVISAESGRRLFAAAREPKELWFEPTVEHAKFFDAMPEEFERRVVGFFDRSLPER
jgi:alpha-beta hydrolase superfamily lysophospholipase